MVYAKIKFTITPSFPGGTEIKIILSHEKDDVWKLTTRYRLYYEKIELYKTIPCNQVKKIIDDITNIKLPMVPQFIVVLDGASYELYIKNGFNVILYRWYGDVPKGFDPLEKLAKILLNWADLPIEYLREDFSEFEKFITRELDKKMKAYKLKNLLKKNTKKRRK